MNLLLDMNLSPTLAELLSSHGHDVVHWAEVGDYRATDVAILTWARAHGRVLVTHDLHDVPEGAQLIRLDGDTESA